ncbi:M50 family metallopeptidase [Nigerium massiliense]|uniref:M50 family metallopeptidase n=1 Tax=Nigerium massiliense TaxID=1522317 RepID=UPI00058C06B7|nr:M50 family metallopeptidase [Nigerium massiliense]
MTLAVTVVFGLLFFALLMASVALHEVGHMVPAKLFGVAVPRYFVGFGRTLWSSRRGETEYGIKLWPLGGFVQLLGMYPPRRPDAKDTRLQRFADEARAVEWDDIAPEQRDRLFYAQPVGRKLLIMAGGITMNLLIAFGLLWGVAGLHGNLRPQPVVGEVPQCIVAGPRDDRACRPTDPRTPAAQAGLRPGDRIVSFNGQPIADYPQLQELIRANLDREAAIVVERGGRTEALAPVHTVVAQVPDPVDPSRRVAAGWLGLSPTLERVKEGPAEVLRDMGRASVQSIAAIVQFPVKVVNVVIDLATGRPRDIYSPISIVGASAAAGEVATAGNATLGDRAAMFASLLASVNLFLALFNLVPLPPLDGGHMAGALYEGARRTVARWRGRPDPGPADTAKMVPVAYAMGAFLLLCGLVLIVADIFSPVKLFG